MPSIAWLSFVERPEILRSLLEKSSSTVYSGIDPTGVSLHVGHILPMMSLVHFQLRGHKAIALVSWTLKPLLHTSDFDEDRWSYSSDR